jgi:hypothetical protein
MGTGLTVAVAVMQAAGGRNRARQVITRRLCPFGVPRQSWQRALAGALASADGLRPMDAKIAAIQAPAPPTNRTELLSLLGLVNSDRCYMTKSGEMAAPINALTHKRGHWREHG